MSRTKRDDNPQIVAIRELFAPLVRQSLKLPAPLAYGFAVILVILVIVLLGGVIPREITILVGIVAALPLGTFIIADWRERRPTSPPIQPDPPPPQVTRLGVPAAGRFGLLVRI